VKGLLHELSAGRDLSRGQMRRAFEEIMSGRADDGVLGDFLQALARKGETVEEIVGAAQVMREHVVPVAAPPGAVDTCGTGGDGVSTFNVSTTAALIAAGAGALVAKHGNRTTTRVSGSAEVLSALGLDLEADVPILERALAEVGLALLYAPRLHPAMRYAQPTRKRLGIRTIFNLLGPLTNPAGVRRQVVGVPRPELTEVLAAVLAELGAAHALVVHGADGLCDLSVTGPSRITELREGKLSTYTVTPEDTGLSCGQLDALLVSSPADSAVAVTAILDGEPGPRRDHAVLNGAAALLVAGVAEDLSDGAALAARAIDSGAAREKLRLLLQVAGRNREGAK